MWVPRVYLVSDRRLAADLPALARAALAGLPPGTAALQLREKDLPARDLLDLARVLRRICAASGQALLVNDRVDVALAAGADGVHLPAAGIPPAEARRLLGADHLVAVSCHGAAEVAQALRQGADFATFGPLFETPSKRAFGPPLGLDRLREAVAMGLPLVGLGGIDVARAVEVRGAGAAGVGVIRAWLQAADPAAAVRSLAGLP